MFELLVGAITVGSTAGPIVAFMWDRSDSNELTSNLVSPAYFETLCNCASIISNFHKTATRVAIFFVVDSNWIEGAGSVCEIEAKDVWEMERG